MITMANITFLKAWFYHMDKSQFIELSFIHDSDKSQRPKSYFLQYDELHKVESITEDHQNNGYGAFFGVTPSTVRKAHGRRKTAEITQIVGFWLDMDTPPKNIMQKLDNLQIKPNFVISSGGGLHAYWRFNQAFTITDDNRAIVLKTIKDFAQAYKTGLGADTACTDLPRVMRIPGTFNLKPKYGKPRPVTFKATLTTSCVDFQLMYKLFYKKPQNKAYTPSQGSNIDVAQVAKYLNDGANEGNRNSYLFYAANRMCDAGKSQSEAEQTLSSRALADGLDHDEIVKTIASAYRR